MWGIHAGRRVRGALSFGSFLWARKERNPSYGGGTPVVNNRRQVTLVFRETWAVNRER